MAIPQHLRDRFFQRYYKELTPEIFAEIRALCRHSFRNLRNPGVPDPAKKDVYHLTISWRGEAVKVVWNPHVGTILTFLAPWMKTHRRPA